MHKSTAAALYALHIDCFLEGLADEVVKPSEFGLTDGEAVVVRKLRYADKIREIRNRRVA